MVDAAVNVAAEQVIEFSAYGALLGRPATAGPPRHRRTSTRPPAPTSTAATTPGWPSPWPPTSSGWRSASALGEPEWAADPALATAAGRVRRARPDRREPGGVVPGPLGRRDRRTAVGCRRARRQGRCSPTTSPSCPVRVPQFFEEVDHPVIGRSRYSTLPMRFSRGPGPAPRTARAAAGRAQRRAPGRARSQRVGDRRARSGRDHRWLARLGGLTPRRAPYPSGWVSRRLRSTSSRLPAACGWSAGIRRRPPGWPCSPPSCAPTSSSTTR